jgi:drug/metabolite transporter (DMT)-like permease
MARRDRTNPALLGASFGLASALLFGATVPFAKLLLGTIEPLLLAGLLYLGSGLGLLATALVTGRLRALAGLREGRIWLWLAVLFGGVLAPVAMMAGLALTPGGTASLLLTLEGVATALIAWFAFRENFDRRVVIGMVAITAGAVVLVWPSEIGWTGLAGPLLIAAACVGWGLDNNFTRKVALADPVLVAMIKGLAAGSVNTVLALGLGAAWPSASALGAVAALGFAGYGVSLVLFVLALRHAGAARTGAYYGTAPFLGAVLAIPLLGEGLSVGFAVAALLMAAGVWLHLTEVHEHDHEHETVDHSHRHRHDVHHQHRHGPGDPQGEPHSHRHRHVRLRHAHAHVPDAHHRHAH